MAGADKIVQSSEELVTAERDLESAARTLTTASSSLESSIPADAFGTMGGFIAAAGNQVAAVIGEALNSLATYAETTAKGTAETRTEFERIEQEAVARFRKIESDSH